MKKTTIVGLIISIAWLGFIGWKIYLDPAKFHELGLNEFGDFLAGAAAPLALGWLVLGYIRQGEELALSVEELRQTAESTKELANQTKHANEISRDEIARSTERQLRQDAAFFVFDGASSNKHGMGVRLKNDGKTVTKVRALLRDPGSPEITTLGGLTHLVRNGEQFTVSIRSATNDERRLFIDYLDINGYKRRDTFKVSSKCEIENELRAEVLHKT